ncbi:MAG: glutamine-hydrolyzing GMP synthase [Bacteroidota bacterium]|nr:glutamine-hydrolyzing GMP synthase [Bacteroidota bacterium]MDP4191632.1 glutamine-hydrolyzing GMP synthase [Bacteroidota bacterium]MDP4196760.1 glutamine-hydrolyzing GMP synthase [Bacteroidota bacterium]
MTQQELILILDFGSQYTQLIARRIRESGVYSEIHPYTISLEKIRQLNPKGIILSGGPMSVYDDGAPNIDQGIFSLGLPILGICYGLQLICKILGGKVEPAKSREYGKANLKISKESMLLQGVKDNSIVWMSHGDYLTEIPSGFEVIATSENSPYCAMINPSMNIFGVQFHPEVVHSEEGMKIINNFLFSICKVKGEWTPKHFIESKIAEIKNTVGNKKAICALSGGVDSSVAAILVNKAIGEKLICVHVDTGLMRLNESHIIEEMFRQNYKLNLISINASDLFLRRLAGVSDPEKKRKIIGTTFIEVFEEHARKFSDVGFLVQGTLYPDVIESVPVFGSSVTIKSHHNVGGLPEKMNLKLIEPFRELFKDEVRRIGRELELPEEFIERHPFPGPGLAVRILGDITDEKLAVLRQADEIFINEIKRAGLYNKIWQAFAVLLPIQTVGVMGDARTYENVVALRAVTSTDGMTADWYGFENSFLADVSNKIIRNIRGINRVVYDISSKPPSTIEWE